MEDLHSLLNSLKRKEIQVLRASLTCYASRIEPETKALKLFEFLLKNNSRVPSASACSLEVYNNKDDKRLKILKTRLKSKILDSLTLDVNIERKGVFNELDHASIKVKKKLTQFHLLYRTRGNHPFALQLLDEVINFSKKFELYESVTEGLKFKKYFSGFCKGIKDFNKINKEIAFYEYCDLAKYKGSDYYYRLILRTDFYGKPDNKKMQEQLKESIIELNKDYKYTRSANVGYYLKLLELAYFFSNNNYLTAREVCLELLDIVKNNKSIFRKQRIGVAHANLSKCYIHIGDYRKAISNTHDGQKYFPQQSVNYPVLKEQEFFALFYNNQLEKAEAAVNKLLKISSKQQGDFRVAKFQFYKANILFKKGNYRKALEILSRNQEISKDKTGWGIAIHILIIISLIELGRNDEAALHVEGLRRHMDRHSKKEVKKGDRERDLLILIMLQHLEKEGFVFNKMNSRIINTLELLSGNSKKYVWECLTPELIPFHEWYASKANYRLPELNPISSKRKEKRVLVRR